MNLKCKAKSLDVDIRGKNQKKKVVLREKTVA